MPNLFIIKDIAEGRNVTVKSVAEKAGITEAGLHGAIKKGDIKFSYLDKIAHFLKVDLSLFSDFSAENNCAGSVSVNGDNSGYVAGGSINNSVNIQAPPQGYEKIIKSDLTIEMHRAGLIENSQQVQNLQEKIDSLQATIDLQQDLIKSQNLTIELLKKKEK